MTLTRTWERHPMDSFPIGVAYTERTFPGGRRTRGLCLQTLSLFLSANVIDPIDPVNCVVTGIFLIAGVSTVSGSMRQNTRCVLPFTLPSQQHTTNSVTADCDCPYRLTFTCRQGITFTLLLTVLRLSVDWLLLQPVRLISLSSGFSLL